MQVKTSYSKALQYAVSGFSIIPVGKNKKPLILSWKQYQEVPADEAQIAKWWEQYPNANVGIITGKVSGITVIDIDVKIAPKTPLETFPGTYTVKTPSGGFHLYYRYFEGIQTCANNFPQYPHVDIRNAGGFVVAPPSEGYTILKNIEKIDFPARLFPQTRKRKNLRNLVGVQSGIRNASIASFIGTLLLSLPEEKWVKEAWAIVCTVNKTYMPPLENAELMATFNSIASLEKQRRLKMIKSPISISNTEIINLQLRKNKSNIPYKDMTNAVYALSVSAKYAKTIKFDVFKNIIEINDKPKTEETTLEIQKFLQQDIALTSIGKQIVEDAIQLHAFNNKYDSAVQYLESLKWDGVPRVDTWLLTTYGVEDNEYTRSVGSNWLRALVQRIMRPGSKFDHVLVIEGEQGIKKTLSFAILGGSWHVETIVEAQSKDFLMQFAGKAIVEFSEGDTLTRSEVKTLKAIITRTHDKFRAPYARSDEEHPRRCVFCMTTNDDSYLKDDTGNRRWWPVKVPDNSAVNTDWLKENRDQLFAEALVRIDEPTWKIPEVLAQEEQEKRRWTNDTEPLIFDWYCGLPDNIRENGVNSYNFFLWLYRKEPERMPKVLDKLTQMQFASMFRTALFLEKKSKRIDNKIIRKFFPTKKTPKFIAEEDATFNLF